MGDDLARVAAVASGDPERRPLVGVVCHVCELPGLRKGWLEGSVDQEARLPGREIERADGGPTYRLLVELVQQGLPIRGKGGLQAVGPRRRVSERHVAPIA